MRLIKFMGWYNKAIKQTKKEVWIGLLILIIIVIGVILIAGNLVKPSLEGAVFYYKGEGKDSKLFYMKSDSKPQLLTTLPSEEVEGNYRTPKISYFSHSGDTMIYFERAEEIPLEELPVKQGFTVYRIIYKPVFIDLKSNFTKKIEQDIDSVSLVFSPDDKKIAWVLRVEEATVEQLESAGKKREVWICDFDGSNARHLATLEEKVVLLQRWYDDYIYFWGIQGVGYYSLGKINTKTGRVQYAQPKYCLEDLANCQNFRFSSSGELFIYEGGLEKKGQETAGLFVESFNGEKSWRILVKNYISDRLWLPDEANIIYTEQVVEPKIGLREKIHLVNLETKEDKEIYSGNYVSQLTPDGSSRYLYFLEKETDEKFNLVRLDIKKEKAEIIDSGEYNQLKILSGL